MVPSEHVNGWLVWQVPWVGRAEMMFKGRFGVSVTFTSGSSSMPLFVILSV